MPEGNIPGAGSFQYSTGGIIEDAERLDPNNYKRPPKPPGTPLPYPPPRADASIDEVLAQVPEPQPDPTYAPLAQEVPESRVAVPGQPLPVIDNPEGTVELTPPGPDSPLPQATVTVEHPDGTVEGPFKVEHGETRAEFYGVISDAPDAPQPVGTVHGEYTMTEITDTRDLLSSRATPAHFPGQRIGPAIITKDGGININGVPIDHGQVVEPVVVRHVDCADNMAELQVTFLVSQVTVEPEAQPLVQEVPHHECEAGCTCQLGEPLATILALINITRGSLRRFVLQRDRDDTGISGTGVVAEGALLSDGRAFVRWLGNNSSVSIWKSLQELINVHGHGGHTRLRWIDTTGPLVAHPDAPR